MATWNKQASLESVRKLQGYQPSLLAVGHGCMIVEPKAWMDKAIAEAERNLQKPLTQRSNKHVTKNRS